MNFLQILQKAFVRYNVKIKTLLENKIDKDNIIQGEGIILDTTTQEGKIIINSNGLPNGGTAGQVLVKQSATNGDVIWSNNNAKDITLSNINFSSNNVEDALLELFIYANNIKSSVADIIGSPVMATQSVDTIVYNIQTLKNNLAEYLTSKMINANGTESLSSLIEKINNISQTITSTTQQTKLDIIAPYTKTFNLSNISSIENICTSLIKYTEGESNHIEYTIGFDESDTSSFIQNNNIIFDGTMHINNIFSYPFDEINVLGNGTYHESDVIQTNDFNTIDKLIVNVQDKLLNITATIGPQIVKSLSSYSIANIDRVTRLVWNVNVQNDGVVLYAISFDAGQTYGAYNINTDTWDIIDINNVSDFLSKGMTPLTVNSLTSEQIEVFRNGNTAYIGAYLLSQSSILDIAENNDLSLIVKLKGTSNFATSDDYTVSYNNETGELTYNILTDGNYTFNYINNI